LALLSREDRWNLADVSASKIDADSRAKMLIYLVENKFVTL
jgi:hypothetical protein